MSLARARFRLKYKKFKRHFFKLFFILALLLVGSYLWQRPTANLTEPPPPEPTGKKSNDYSVNWIKNSIIDELSSLTSTRDVKTRFKFYQRKHILSFGPKKIFHSNDDDYVFLNNGTSVLGVFQFQGGAYKKIRADQTFEQLKLQGTDVQEIWVHFPTNAGNY